MTPPLFLIAHVVRGEPAFDIAQPLTIGDEEGWIIPTSGHRAYPYWYMRLIDLTWETDKGTQDIEDVGPAPAGHPDHYPTNRSADPAKPDLLTALGLRKPLAPIKRRI